MRVLCLCFFSLFVAVLYAAPGDTPVRIKSGKGVPFDADGSETYVTSGVKSGMSFFSDTEFVRSKLSPDNTDRRCYGPAGVMQFHPGIEYSGDVDFYRCNRGGNPISYVFPGVPNGSYRLTLYESEDKWQEYAKSNNGRATSVFINGEYVDIFEIFGEIGNSRTAVDIKYCVEITDGQLRLDLVTFAEASTYGAIVSAVQLEEVVPGSCTDSRFDRHFDSWYTGPGAGWLYAINSASGSYTSASGVKFQPDWGYQFEKIPDAKGLLRPDWDGSIGWRECPFSISCTGDNWGTAGCPTSCHDIAGTTDDWLFYHVRSGSKQRYRLPIATPGWHQVVVLTMDADFPNRRFNITFEKGEGAHQSGPHFINPSELACPGAPCTEKAVGLSYYVNVRGPNFDFEATIVAGLPNPSTRINALMLRKASDTGDSRGQLGGGLVYALSEAPPGGAPPCAPDTVCPAGRCGLWSDGCSAGATLDCGSCPMGQKCNSLKGPYANQGTCEPDCSPRACLLDECGQIDNTCGGYMHCGSCPGQNATQDDLCVRNRCVAPISMSTLPGPGTDPTGAVVLRVKCGKTGNFDDGTNGHPYPQVMGQPWYEPDRQYVTSPKGGTAERCYGPENYMKFYQQDVDLYRCTRSDNPITYRFPQVGNGKYMVKLMLSDDKWTEFPKSNNGRPMSISIEGTLRDILVPFQRIGYARAAMDQKYCVEVTDGALDISLTKTAPWTYSPLISALEVHADPTGVCSHSIFERVDTWYKGPLMDPHVDPALAWVYAINVGGGPYLSVDRVWYQVDGHFMYDMDPVSGAPRWHGNRDWGENQADWANTDDDELFQTRRITSSEGGMPEDPSYEIPLEDGWWQVLILTGEHDYGGADFHIHFERGEPTAYTVSNVKPELWAGGNEAAVGILSYIQVSGGKLNIDLETITRGEVGGLMQAILIRPHTGTANIPSVGGGTPIHNPPAVPVGAVAHPCIVANNCKRSASWCPHVSSSECTFTAPSSGSSAPTSKAPSSSAPTSKSPTSLAPTSLSPTSAAPSMGTRLGGTFSPTSRAPTSRAPTSFAPTSKTPTSAGPTSKAPTSKAPTAPPSPTAGSSSGVASLAPFSCVVLFALIIFMHQ